MIRRRSPLLILIASLQCSCATKQVALDLREYPDLPTARTSLVLRAIANSNQFLRSRGLWGNYGGPGDAGGAPIDALDEIFHQHDLAYLRGVEHHELLAADRRLISQLEALDPITIGPAADAYRRRAIRYFSRPISRVVGKPPNVLFGWKTRPAIIDTSNWEKNTK